MNARFSRRRAWLAPVALGLATIAVVAVAIGFVGSPASSGNSGERIATAAEGVVETTVSGTGDLSPVKQTELDFQADGEIVAIYVAEGDRVRKGELLARVDDSGARVDLAQARADLQTAKDQLETAEDADSNGSASAMVYASTGAAPTKQEQEEQAPQQQNTTTTPAQPQAQQQPQTQQQPSTAAPQTTSPDSGSSSTMSVDSAQAAVDSAELAVDDAKKTLSNTYLRAPMAGTVAALNGEVGNQAGTSSGAASESAASGATGATGATPGASTGSSSTSSAASEGLITLAQLHTYTMEVSLSESDIGKVKRGQAASVTVNASTDEKFEAHVTSISVMSSTSGSTSGSSAVSYPVELTLDQSSKALKPGMSASADIVVDRAAGVTVPSQAVQGRSVTVDNAGERTTKQVQPGAVGESTTQIVSGLSAGDRVVVRSQSASAGANASGQAGGGAAGGGGPGGGLGGGRGGFPGGGGGAGGFPGGGPPGGFP